MERPNWRKCGSSVGSKNAQVFDTTTITNPVIIMDGILNSLSMEADLEPTAYSEKKKKLNLDSTLTKQMAYLCKYNLLWV